jgi:hypothetical protein
VCPELNENICEIAGVRPDTIECLDGPCCYRKKYELCKLHIAEYTIGVGIAA